MNIELFILAIIMWSLSGVINIVHFSPDIERLKPEYKRWAYIKMILVGGPIVWVLAVVQALLYLLFNKSTGERNE